MTNNQFDALLAALARTRSRRETMAALAIALSAGPVAPDTIQARKRDGIECLGHKERCKRKSECCSGRCRSGQSKSKKRKCSCSPRGAHCVDGNDCCTKGSPLICAAGFCVPDR